MQSPNAGEADRARWSRASFRSAGILRGMGESSERLRDRDVPGGRIDLERHAGRIGRTGRGARRGGSSHCHEYGCTRRRREALRRRGAASSMRVERVELGRLRAAARLQPLLFRLENLLQQEPRRGAIAALDEHRRGDRLEPVRRARLGRGLAEPLRGAPSGPAAASNGRTRCRGSTATSSAARRCPCAAARSPDPDGPARRDTPRSGRSRRTDRRS